MFEYTLNDDIGALKREKTLYLRMGWRWRAVAGSAGGLSCACRSEYHQPCTKIAATHMYHVHNQWQMTRVHVDRVENGAIRHITRPSYCITEFGARVLSFEFERRESIISLQALFSAARHASILPATP